MQEHQQLIQGLQRGSYEDFDKLYAIYADMLYSFVLHLTKSRSEAGDVVQETFMRVWDNREWINPQLSFKAYLFTIARNLIVSSLRKMVGNATFEDYVLYHESIASAENTTEVSVYFDDFKRLVEQAKIRLTTRQRLVFELSREQGYSLDQIACQLNIPLQTIKNNLSQALKILRNELKDYKYVVFWACLMGCGC